MLKRVGIFFVVVNVLKAIVGVLCCSLFGVSPKTQL